MAEGNASDGCRKLRSVFGDVTNQLGKRRSSEKETCGIKRNNFKDQDRVKQARVLPRPCTEINSLKGNVISSISKVPNEKKDADALDLCKDSAVSKSTAEVEDVSKNSGKSDHFKKEKNVKRGSSRSLDENKDPKILDLSSEDAVSKMVIQGDVIDNDIADRCNQIDSFKDSAISWMGKMVSGNSVDPNVAELGAARAFNHIEIEADVRDEIDSSKENVIRGIPNMDGEKKCSSLIDTGSGRVAEVIVSNSGDGAMHNSKISSKNENQNLLDLDKGKGLHGINAEAINEFIDSFITKISVPNSETGGDSVLDGKNCNDDEAKVSYEGTQSETDRQTYGDDDNVDSYVLSQSGSIDCNVLPESQESRVFGLERCTELKKGSECANMSGGIDLIKACSCSFCTKAAYIWLDLHYQDTKARISAIKKSQKEASILAARSCRSKATDKHGLGNSSRVSKLESDLMHQWRYLFQHMVDTCEHESNQLETNLLPLMELREQCRTDLEHINASSSEKR
ncbi:unnamed protein product [Fraxinus pennsylvanica]|uniref:DNA-directed RNA polymerase n=1 Tax=Fraxinus pennsylvanica TaxID=56036 RepID=A0AAD2DXJ6_9LAMI|nr:unnamed protein product [Fraxinus pennsylvanica]